MGNTTIETLQVQLKADVDDLRKQMDAARKGIVTPELETVARKEQMRVERARIYTPSDDEDWYYSHHPFVTGFDGKLYAFYSSGRRNEDDCGQRNAHSLSKHFL